MLITHIPINLYVKIITSPETVDWHVLFIFIDTALIW